MKGDIIDILTHVESKKSEEEMITEENHQFFHKSNNTFTLNISKEKSLFDTIFTLKKISLFDTLNNKK